MSKTALAYLVVTILCWLGPNSIAKAQLAAPDVVLDISHHRISINSGFTGTSLLLFGAIKGQLRGVDMVVVIRGPNEHLVARKKERMAGIWVHRDAVEFDNVPSYYRVISTQPLEVIMPQRILHRHNIGLNYITPTPINKSRRFSQKEILTFKQAVIRDKKRLGLYAEESDAINIISDALFRSEIFFPAVVPTGLYSVEVFLVKNKQIVGAQTSPLFVNKTGLERAVFSFANDHPVWYGILAVLAATLTGLGAAQLFRKG